MRIIIIDPKTRTIQERDIGAESQDDIYEHFREIIGGYLERAAFVVPNEGVNNVLFTDEEFLCHERNYFFTLAGWGTQPYASVCIFCSTVPGSEGHEVSGTNLLLAEVIDRTVFLGELKIGT